MLRFLLRGHRFVLSSSSPSIRRLVRGAEKGFRTMGSRGFRQRDGSLPLYPGLANAILRSKNLVCPSPLA